MKRPPRTVVLAAALISGVAVAALILCTTLFLRSYRSAVVEGARTNSAQVVSQVAGAVDNYVNTMDSAVGIVLEQLDSEPAMRDAFLNAFLTARPEVAAITTYDENGSLLDCWAQAGRTPKSDILRNLSFDLTTARRLGHGYISTPHVESIFDSYYPWVVSVIRAVPGDGGSSRWLAVDLSFKELAATINNVSIGQHGYCYLMDERGNMVYHPQQQLIYSDLKQENTALTAELADGAHVEGNTIYTVQTLSSGSWRVVGVSSVQELITDGLQEVLRISVISALFILAAMLMLSVLLSRMLSQPIQNLVSAMRSFEKNADNFSYEPVTGVREVQNLSVSFEHMVRKIQKLMARVRSEEVNLRKTELKALQAQINPHFLYNTLDSISWMCEQGKNAEAVVMVNALARLFRISISKGHELIPIRSEVQHAQSYLQIQSVRYKEQFSYHFDVEEDCTEYLCNKITLQPIIENAIYHGVNGLVDEGHIEIRVRAEGEDVLFTVEDNGVGMEPEQIEEIFRRKPDGKSGIGIKNVNDRLKIWFGDAYGITIESVPDEGTKVTVRMPKVREEAEHEKH